MRRIALYIGLIVIACLVRGNLFGAGAPAMLGAIKPQVIIVNNGPRTGLGQADTAVQLLGIRRFVDAERPLVDIPSAAAMH